MIRLLEISYSRDYGLQIRQVNHSNANGGRERTGTTQQTANYKTELLRGMRLLIPLIRRRRITLIPLSLSVRYYRTTVSLFGTSIDNVKTSRNLSITWDTN